MVGAVITGASTAIGLVNSLGLGGVDPAREAERKNAVNVAKQGALLAGTRTSKPYIQLAAWAGNPTSAEQELARSYGLFPDSNGNWGLGSDSARLYAKAAKLEVDGKAVVQSVVDPFVNQVVVEKLQSNAPVILGVLLVVLVGVFLLGKRRG